MNIVRMISLRQALIADAVMGAVFGVLLTVGAGFLAPLLGLPETLLRSVGVILLPFAAALAYIGTRRPIRPAAAWAVIGINVLWVVDSIVLLLSGWVTPNTFGTAFIVFQAVAVALFAEVEYVALRAKRTSAV